MDEIEPARAGPVWSFQGFRLGALLALPLMPGIVAFGLAVGTTTAGKGFSFLEAVAMNGIVYAGLSQMVAMEIWPQRMTLAAVALLALLAAIVNARMLLMGAALRPWLAPLPAWQTYPMLYLLTDVGWLIAMRYREQGGNDPAVLLGGGVLIWLAWMSSTAAGHLAGILIRDPRAFGLDLVMPIFFAVMLIPLWGGRRRGLAWIVAGAVALVVERLGFGWWFVLAGALAGALVEGVRDE